MPNDPWAPPCSGIRGPLPALDVGHRAPVKGRAVGRCVSPLVQSRSKDSEDYDGKKQDFDKPHLGRGVVLQDVDGSASGTLIAEAFWGEETQPNELCLVQSPEGSYI